MTAKPEVSVILVNWNGGEAVLASLSSIRAQTHPAAEVIVVDNASTDGSLEQIVLEFPEVELIRLHENVGFGGAVNRGVATASGQWLALLNSDAVADPDWLARLAAATETRADVAMVACKIYLDRGARLLDKVGHRITLDGQNFGRGHRTVDRGQYDSLDEVAWPDGCASLWRRDVFLRLGGLDESFFAYADDAELGIRFRIAGWRCAFAPQAIVEHRHSRSLGPYSPRKLYLVERNRIWLVAIYFPWHLVLLNPFLWLYRALLTLSASRTGRGPWSQVATANRLQVLRAISAAQIAGWLGAATQRRKRGTLAARCAPDWRRRLGTLLREAKVGMRELARGDVT